MLSEMALGVIWDFWKLEVCYAMDLHHLLPFQFPALAQTLLPYVDISYSAKPFVLQCDTLSPSND